MKPGDEVTLRTMGRGERAEVIEVRGGEVVIRTAGGKRRLVRRERLVIDRPTPLLPPPPSPAERRTSREFEPRAQPVPKPEPPTRSKSYLDWIRAKPCCSCGAAAPSDPHHFGSRGMGQKTDDHRTVPLCRRCHDRFHDTGALPNMDAATTRVFLLGKQVGYLIGWIERPEGRKR